MPCEDWDPDDAPQAAAILTVCASGLAGLRVEATSKGSTLRWVAGGQFSVEVRPDLRCRIRRSHNTVTVEIDSAETVAMPRPCGVADGVERRKT